jgi:hypothetical protein
MNASHVKSFATQRAITHAGFSHNSHTLFDCLRTWASRLFRLFSGRLSNGQGEPSQIFVSRISQGDVETAIKRVLGRRLLRSEVSAFQQAWRPQVLLNADDSYSFRVASARFLGRAVSVFVYALAADGYAKFDSKPLALVECALVTIENPGVNSPAEFID